MAYLSFVVSKQRDAPIIRGPISDARTGRIKATREWISESVTARRKSLAGHEPVQDAGHYVTIGRLLCVLVERWTVNAAADSLTEVRTTL